jgi:hypothetical protein
VYWYFLYVICSVVFVWVVLIVYSKLKLHKRYPASDLLMLLRSFCTYGLSVIGNLLFIPIISLLLEVFVCVETIGDDIDDAVLDKDCHQTCWDSTHVAFVAVSMICLVCYTPLAVYVRPRLQKMQKDPNVVTLPLYLVIKSVVSVLLIALSKTISHDSNVGHSILFMLILLGLIGIVHWIRPYYYNRFNLWQKAILAGLIWLTFLSLINHSAEINSAVAIAFLIIGGWLILGALTLGWQGKYKLMYPKMLFVPKELRFKEKFRFMFSNMERGHIQVLFSRKSSMINERVAAM